MINEVGRGLSKRRFPGKHRFVHRFGRAVSKVCPEADCFPHPRGRLTVRLADRAERLMWAGCYEPGLALVLNRMLRPGMVFVDVGAHVGYFTVLAAVLVGPDGAVYAFEPDPECFERLVLSTKTYGWVRPARCAVGDEAGETAFFRTPRAEETGWGTIFPTGEPRRELRVPMITLDGSLAELGARRVDFIKIDVEGAEARVLQGAEKTIDRFRPAVYFEANAVCLKRDDRLVEDLIGFFTAKGYEIRAVPGERASAPDNFLAVPGEKSTPGPEWVSSKQPSSRMAGGFSMKAAAPVPKEPRAVHSVVALLGRRDEPTDGVRDYCRWLARAFDHRGVKLVETEVPWAEQGWRRALASAERCVREERPAWALLEYTALSWSKWGFPLGFLRLVRRLKKTRARLAIVFHDPMPFGGRRLRDRLRSGVQLAVMRRSARIADRVVSTVSPECLPWMQEPQLRAKVALIPIGSNIPPPSAEAPARPADRPIVAVFGVTEDKQEEAALIAQIIRGAEQQLGPLRLLVMGRGAEQAEANLRRLLEGSHVDLRVYGILPPEQIGELLSTAQAQLFVRAGISSRRGSAIAGIAAGLAVVGFANEETGFPITEAGVRLVPRDKPDRLTQELVAVLTDSELREGLRQRSQDAARRYFSWSAVAGEYLRLLRDPES
jgi:FkbM family methyltransferase